MGSAPRVDVTDASSSAAARALISAAGVPTLQLDAPQQIARGRGRSRSTGREYNVSLDQAIREGAVLRQGDSGQAVREMQQRLTAEGFGVQATGTFGSTTASVLGDFQRSQGVQPTRQYGPTTHAALERAERGTEIDVPMVDQYTLNHPRDWAFCGIATTMTVLDANDLPVPANNEAALSEFAAPMYIPGQGTFGGGMAQVLRDAGLSSAEFTTTGSIADITSTLDSGQPVPLGVWSAAGEVIEVPNGQSSRYPNLSVGDRHQHTFGPSGHWLVVDGYEGSADNPSHFTVSDPDSGTRLASPRQSSKPWRAATAPSGSWGSDLGDGAPSPGDAFHHIPSEDRLPDVPP
ncbi:MAG: peptidoglycan-binding protein [Myxococcota bacterium]